MGCEPSCQKIICLDSLVLSLVQFQTVGVQSCECLYLIKRPARDACLCMGELQAPPAPHFVFLITL